MQKYFLNVASLRFQDKYDDKNTIDELFTKLFGQWGSQILICFTTLFIDTYKLRKISFLLFTKKFLTCYMDF